MARVDDVATALAFVRLTPTTRAQIAMDLGVYDGVEAMRLSSQAEAREILRRVVAAGKLYDLSTAVKAHER